MPQDEAQPRHEPVLLQDVLRLLDPRPGEIAVDCTAGLGGHAAALAERVGPEGLVIAFDVDEENLARAAQRVRAAGGRLEPVRDNFVAVPARLASRGVAADMLLADLGFSSNQMDDPARGFSFRSEGPLDMRLDRSQTLTAADLVNGLTERELADLIHRLGEEPLARKIARKLVQTRKIESINTTEILARLVREAYGPRARSSRMDPATRTFMALRIAVNDELNALSALLRHIEREAERIGRRDAGHGWLHPGARVAFICFHSLEDRLVKQAFAGWRKRGLAEVLTKKPLAAGEEEVGLNPRSRSAKLRAARIAAPHVT
jgi:16S rRNA (cytosine1402-N4)-methyltransferase